MKKKDMYLNYNNAYSGRKKGKRRLGRRGRKSSFLYAFIILIIAIVLGFLAFYIANEVLAEPKQDYTLNEAKKLNSEVNQGKLKNNMDSTNKTGNITTILGKVMQKNNIADKLTNNTHTGTSRDNLNSDGNQPLIGKVLL